MLDEKSLFDISYNFKLFLFKVFLRDYVEYSLSVDKQEEFIIFENVHLLICGDTCRLGEFAVLAVYGLFISFRVIVVSLVLYTVGD